MAKKRLANSAGAQVFEAFSCILYMCMNMVTRIHMYCSLLCIVYILYIYPRIRYIYIYKNMDKHGASSICLC